MENSHIDYKFDLFFYCALRFLLRFRVEKFSHDLKTFPSIVKCAVFDELDILNLIYIFCACALPKKDSHMDDKIPLRHIYIIHHISPYNCHLVTTCRNTSIHKWRHEYITNGVVSPLGLENMIWYLALWLVTRYGSVLYY